MISEALHRHLSLNRKLWIQARRHHVARLRMSLEYLPSLFPGSPIPPPPLPLRFPPQPLPSSPALSTCHSLPQVLVSSTLYPTSPTLPPSLHLCPRPSRAIISPPFRPSLKMLRLNEHACLPARGRARSRMHSRTRARTHARTHTHTHTHTQHARHTETRFLQRGDRLRGRRRRRAARWIGGSWRRAASARPRSRMGQVCQSVVCLSACLPACLPACLVACSCVRMRA